MSCTHPCTVTHTCGHCHALTLAHLGGRHGLSRSCEARRSNDSREAQLEQGQITWRGGYGALGCGARYLLQGMGGREPSGLLSGQQRWGPAETAVREAAAAATWIAESTA